MTTDRKKAKTTGDMIAALKGLSSIKKMHENPEASVPEGFGWEETESEYCRRQQAWLAARKRKSAGEEPE